MMRSTLLSSEYFQFRYTYNGVNKSVFWYCHRQFCVVTQALFFLEYRSPLVLQVFTVLVRTVTE